MPKKAGTKQLSRSRTNQMLIRRIDDSLKEKLQLRAEKHGHSMEEEVRSILRDAVKDNSQPEKGLGTRIAERFRGLGLREEDFPQLKITLRVPKFD
jgi:plasmid stability protein